MGTPWLLCECDTWERPHASGLARPGGCGCTFVVLGSFDPENGHQCGECEVLGDHAWYRNKHAAHIKLLASGRSTSELLSLLRNYIVRQRLADMSAGTLGEAMQNYEVRLQRANCRLTLEGVPYGFRPVFLRLNRIGMSPFSDGRDCMDLVLDFLLDCHGMDCMVRDCPYLGLATPSTDYARSSTSTSLAARAVATTTRLEFELLHLPARAAATTKQQAAMASTTASNIVNGGWRQQWHRRRQATS